MKGTEMRKLRKASGLRSAEVARELGVSPESVSRWEAGKYAISQLVESAFRALMGDEKLEEIIANRRKRVVAARKEAHVKVGMGQSEAESVVMLVQTPAEDTAVTVPHETENIVDSRGHDHQFHGVMNLVDGPGFEKARENAPDGPGKAPMATLVQHWKDVADSAVGIPHPPVVLHHPDVVFEERELPPGMIHPAEVETVLHDGRIYSAGSAPAASLHFSTPLADPEEFPKSADLSPAVMGIPEPGEYERGASVPITPIPQETVETRSGPDVEKLRRVLQTKLKQFGRRGALELAVLADVSIEHIIKFANDDGGLSESEYDAVMRVIREGEGV